MNPPPTDPDSDLFAIERPDRSLLLYYTLGCIPMVLFPPLAIAVWLHGYFRYHTLRYRFDDEGVSMRWGILFRREIILNYARIQDIHLTSNFIERWLGLARIQIQTASGSATPEMTIEGLKQFEEIRTFLYRRMRGTQDPVRRRGPSDAPPAGSAAVGSAELAGVLREVATELRGLREDLGGREGL